MGVISPGPEPSPATRRILITGSAGCVGQAVRQRLEGQYEIRGLDRRRGAGVDVVADMRKFHRICRAFEGIDTVVDLAGDPRLTIDWQTVRENNIVATLNAFEAARIAGVRRIVYASSNHVTGMRAREEPYASVLAGNYDGLNPHTLPRIDADAPIRPDGPYAVGKALGEATARYYADEFGLSVICLRIGQVNRENRPKNAGHFATLLTHRDLAQLVRCCIEAPPSIRFAVFYGVSANTWRIWDIETSKEAIGYVPEDDAERFR